MRNRGLRSTESEVIFLEKHLEAISESVGGNTLEFVHPT
jgi:hypothetical protein